MAIYWEEEIIKLTLEGWQRDLKSVSPGVRELALYDLKCAARAPENIPLISCLSVALGREPAEVLKMLASKRWGLEPVV